MFSQRNNHLRYNQIFKAEPTINNRQDNPSKSFWLVKYNFTVMPMRFFDYHILHLFWLIISFYQYKRDSCIYCMVDQFMTQSKITKHGLIHALWRHVINRFKTVKSIFFWNITFGIASFVSEIYLKSNFYNSLSYYYVINIILEC